TSHEREDFGTRQVEASPAIEGQPTLRSQHRERLLLVLGHGFTSPQVVRAAQAEEAPMAVEAPLRADAGRGSPPASRARSVGRSAGGAAASASSTVARWRARARA